MSTNIGTTDNPEFLPVRAKIDTEQEIILTSHISTPKNSKLSTAGGKATDDKIFLLDTAESEKYLTLEARKLEEAYIEDDDYTSTIQFSGW